MGEGEQARDAIEGGAEVVAVALVRRSRVDRHPRPQAVHRGEVRQAEGALSCERGRSRRFGPRERDAERD